MNEFSSSKKIVYAAGTVLLLFLLVLTVLFVKPKIGDVYASKDNLEKVQMTLEFDKEDAGKAGYFQGLKRDVEADFYLIDGALLTEENLITFIERVEQLNEEVGTKLQKSQYQSSKKSGAVAPSVFAEDPEAEAAKIQAELDKEKNTQRLKFEVEGKYKQFLEFLFKLENLPFVFNIDSVVIVDAKMKTPKLKLDELDPELVNGEIIISFMKKY